MSEPHTGPPPRAGRPWLLWALLVAITVGVVAAIATSEISGTGAENVGDTARTEAPNPTSGPVEPDEPARNCDATESNPGGANNYIADAPRAESLGEGFVVTGFVRSAAGCEPIGGIPVQVWLATETGGEQDNRATVISDEDGRFRIETDPTIPQFGEPNIHVAYDGDRYQPVFIRRVVDLDDTRATVNLTLAGDG